MRQGRKTDDARPPRKLPPWQTRDDWDIDAVVSLGTSAIGDGIEWLRHRRPSTKLLKGSSSGEKGSSESYVLVGQLVTLYVAAAAKLAKESRDGLSDKNLKNVTQKQLTELLVNEVKRDPELRAAVVKAIAETRAALS